MKVGNVVRLKSGGPSMTVARIRKSGGRSVIDCVWYDKGEIMTFTFYEECLVFNELLKKSTE